MTCFVGFKCLGFCNLGKKSVMWIILILPWSRHDEGVNGCGLEWGQVWIDKGLDWHNKSTTECLLQVCCSWFFFFFFDSLFSSKLKKTFHWNSENWRQKVDIWVRDLDKIMQCEKTGQKDEDDDAKGHYPKDLPLLHLLLM